MTLPKVLCIGAQKAGTSWLHENLKWNSGAWLPPFKELHFFDHRFVPTHRRWVKEHVARGLRLAIREAELSGSANELAYLRTLSEPPLMTRNWYRRVFAPCPQNKVGIDVTPEYSSIPLEGVEYVEKLLGQDLRIIYLIRDPVERALSQIRMYVGRRKSAPKTQEDWQRMLSEPDLLDRGNYAEHIPRWQAVFPDRCFLFIPFGHIPSRPHQVLQKVEAFCGLPTASYPKADEAVYKGPIVSIPESVIQELKVRLSNQVEFIEGKFGSQFLAECRGAGR